MSFGRIGIVALVAVFGAAACTLAPVRRGPAPEGYAERPSPHPGTPFPNWPTDPHRFDDLLLKHHPSVAEGSEAGAGTTGAEKLTLKFADTDDSFDCKWKPMPARWSPVAGRLDGINNSPRKELAAWKIQRLFLEPVDYVVPASVAYCAPIEQVKRRHPDSQPTLKGSSCVLGVAALWLRDLSLPDPLLDPERFDRDYVYAYYLANLNLFTYLVKHHDGRDGNFLISKNDARRQVFAIDNGVSFGGLFYNWFVPNWNSIRVPALRRESIERLRALRREDLDQTLGVVAQLERNEAGVYVNRPLGPNLDAGAGVRQKQGVLQLGLTEGEIGAVWQRIQDLIEDVDDGKIAVF
jgi:hypothetical protein